MFTGRILCSPPRRAILLVLLLLQNITFVVGEGETKQMLDDMARFWGRDQGYPDRYYDELAACFQRWNEPVLEAQDASWRGFYDLWISGGVSEDTIWDQANPNWLDQVNNKSGFYGGHPESIADENAGNVEYEIIERCNYVSNMAQYNSALRVCRRADQGNWNIPDDMQSALMKSYSTLAISSFFFHGSMTNLGGAWDAKMSSIAAFNNYRIMTMSVDTNSTIFRFFRKRFPDPRTFVELVDTSTFFPLNLSVGEWHDYIVDIRTPDQEDAAAGMLLFGCGIILALDTCLELLTGIANELLDEQKLEFFFEEYVPELRMLLQQEDLPLPLWQGLSLAPKLIGIGVSFFWALAFQEKRLPTPGLEGPIFNTTCLAAFSHPVVDLVISTLTGVGNPVKAIYNQKGEECPGAKFCNKDSPHALWHQLSADALFEGTVVSDEVNKILQDRKDRRKSGWLENVVSGFQNLRGSRGED